MHILAIDSVIKLARSVTIGELEFTEIAGEAAAMWCMNVCG